MVPDIYTPDVAPFPGFPGPERGSLGTRLYLMWVELDWVHCYADG